MSWSLNDPGLPPLPGGHTQGPPSDRTRHGRACRWIAGQFPGAIARGHRGRARLAGVSDRLLLEQRSAIASELRRATVDLAEYARTPIRDRALLIELAATASEVRELMVEAEAIGVAVEVAG